MFWGRLGRLFQDGAQLSTEDETRIVSECIEYRSDYCMNCQCSLPPLQSLHPGWGTTAAPRSSRIFVQLFEGFFEVFSTWCVDKIPLILGDLQDNAFFQN
jgi:hypothetical protein